VDPTILFQDNHVAVIHKPPGWLSQGDHTGVDCLVDWFARYRQETERKPGKAYVGLVHRLDRPVSGVMLLAKTSKAAARLTVALQSGAIRKSYWAVLPAGGWQPGHHGVWQAALLKDPTTNLVRVASEKVGAQPAVTRFHCRLTTGNRALVELQPITGRSHQLRVHCRHFADPIVGDARYGSAESWPPPGLALHAVALDWPHPIGQQPQHHRQPPFSLPGWKSLPTPWRDLEPLTTAE
jgi:23S rRNA pseudouridine1911/1915/1917 synthase